MKLPKQFFIYVAIASLLMLLGISFFDDFRQEQVQLEQESPSNIVQDAKPSLEALPQNSNFDAAATKKSNIPLKSSIVHECESCQAGENNHSLKLESINDILATELKAKVKSLDTSAQKKAFKTIQEYVKTVQDLDGLDVDAEGGVYITCSHSDRKSASRAHVEKNLDAQSDAKFTKPVPISSPPIFHSKADSQNIIYLDFNGGLIADTPWNSSHAVYEWDALAYGDEDELFSIAEQQHIYRVWQELSEDFLPFDVDVTTEEPSAFGVNVIHIMITPGEDKLGQELPHAASGGIAYLNVFGEDASRMICFVDSENGIFTADACAHEVGHMLSLSHDGTSKAKYFAGHGEAPAERQWSGTYWSPIMGAGASYISQWSKGEYSDASNQEDDIAIIASKLEWREDDFSHERAQAKLLTSQFNSIQQSAKLTKFGDLDLFLLPESEGLVELTVKTLTLPPRSGSNLNLAVQIEDGSGRVIQAFSQEGTLEFQTLVRERYYIRVKANGEGNPVTNAYSDYASLGQYELHIKGAFGDEPKAVLEDEDTLQDELADLAEATLPHPSAVTKKNLPSAEQEGNLSDRSSSARDGVINMKRNGTVLPQEKLDLRLTRLSLKQGYNFIAYNDEYPEFLGVELERLAEQGFVEILANGDLAQAQVLALSSYSLVMKETDPSHVASFINTNGLLIRSFSENHFDFALEADQILQVFEINAQAPVVIFQNPKTQELSQNFENFKENELQNLAATLRLQKDEFPNVNAMRFLGLVSWDSAPLSQAYLLMLKTK